MEIILAIISRLIAMLLPAILDKADDTCEEGSDKDVENWRETIKRGWSDAAIEETNQ